MWRRIPAPLLYAAFAFTIFFLWLAAHWPGLFIIDTFPNLDDAFNGYLSPWVSVIYSAYLIALISISKDPVLIGFVQIIGAVVGSTCIFAWMWMRAQEKWVVTTAFIFYVLSPFNGIMNIQYSRDWLFSWALCGLAMYFGTLLYEARVEGRMPTRRHAVILMLWACLTAGIRQDAIFIAMVVPLLFIVHFHKQRRATLVMGSLAFFIAALFLYMRPRLHEQIHNYYALTGIVNPLSHLVNNGYKTETAQLDYETIDQVLDMKILKTLRNDFEIPAYHQGGVREPVSDADLAALQRVYFKMVRENPGLFLQNRFKMWDAIMGNQNTFYFSDDLRPQQLAAIDVPEQLRYIKKSPLSDRLNEFADTLARILIFDPGPIFRLIFASAWPAFFLMAAILATFWFFPISASVSAIILCRLPIVFLGAPAPQLKYIYSVYLIGFFLVPLLYMENSLKKR